MLWKVFNNVRSIVATIIPSLAAILGILAFDPDHLIFDTSNFPIISEFLRPFLLLFVVTSAGAILFFIALRNITSPVGYWGKKTSGYRQLKSIELYNTVIVVGLPYTGKSTMLSNLFFDATEQDQTEQPESVVWAANRGKDQYHIGFIDMPRKFAWGEKESRRISDSLIIMVDHAQDEGQTRIDPERKLEHMNFITGLAGTLHGEARSFKRTLVVFSKWDLWKSKAQTSKTYIEDIMDHINDKSVEFGDVFGSDIRHCNHSNQSGFLQSINKIIDFSVTR